MPHGTNSGEIANGTDPRVGISDLLGGVCRYCGNPVAESEAAITHSYWQGLPFLCHKACKEAGVKQEAFDCQLIDADCNDCRHYKRGTLAPKVVSHLKKPDGRITTVTHQPNIIVGGRCVKFDRPTVAQPNKWSGFECFEHRRAGVVLNDPIASSGSLPIDKAGALPQPPNADLRQDAPSKPKS